MDNIRLYTGVLLFLCMFSLADFESIGRFITERKIVQKYKNSEKMLDEAVEIINSMLPETKSSMLPLSIPCSYLSW